MYQVFSFDDQLCFDGKLFESMESAKEWIDSYGIDDPDYYTIKKVK